MALSRSFTLALWVASLTLMLSASALAEEFIVNASSENCRVFQLVGREWVNAIPDVLGVPGSRVEASPISGRDDEVTLTRGTKRFAVTKTCLTPVSGKGSSSLGVYVAYLSWQQPGVLLGPDGTGYPMMATLRGTQAGLEWRKMPLENLELGVGAWGYLGSGDLGAPSSASVTLPVSYAAAGAASRGAAGEITVGFKPGKDRVVVGPAISFLYESTDWPTPDGGSMIISSHLMAIVALRSRFELGRLSLLNEVGFIGAASNLYWSMGASFRLR